MIEGKEGGTMSQSTIFRFRHLVIFGACLFVAGRALTDEEVPTHAPAPAATESPSPTEVPSPAASDTPASPSPDATPAADNGPSAQSTPAPEPTVDPEPPRSPEQKWLESLAGPNKKNGSMAGAVRAIQESGLQYQGLRTVGDVQKYLANRREWLAAYERAIGEFTNKVATAKTQADSEHYERQRQGSVNAYQSLQRQIGALETTLEAVQR